MITRSEKDSDKRVELTILFEKKTTRLSQNLKILSSSMKEKVMAVFAGNSNGSTFERSFLNSVEYVKNKIQQVTGKIIKIGSKESVTRD